MKFPYQKEESRLFGEIHRPVVEFEIKTEFEWISVLAYIDSGADVTFYQCHSLKFLELR